MEVEGIYNQAQRDIITSLSYFSVMNKLFSEDVRICLEEYSKLKPESDRMYFWYRATLRSFYSYIDGIIYVMKDIILWAHERKELCLNENEILIIKESRPVFTKGRITSVPSYNSFETNFDVALLFFPQVFRSDFKINKGDHRYSFFKKALEYRHTVTHPKKFEDYLPPAEGAGHLRNAIIWFAKSMKELISSCGSSSEHLQREIIERHGGTLEGYRRSTQ